MVWHTPPVCWKLGYCHGGSPEPGPSAQSSAVGAGLPLGKREALACARTTGRNKHKKINTSQHWLTCMIKMGRLLSAAGLCWVLTRLPFFEGKQIARSEFRRSGTSWRGDWEHPVNSSQGEGQYLAQRRQLPGGTERCLQTPKKQMLS